MRKGFLVQAITLMACLMCSIGAMAQEAYANFTPTDSTLTFYYDELRSSREGTSYLVNAQDSVPAWYENREKVTQVVFDTTFVDARPTSTRCWFYEMTKLDSITGIRYLKTDSVTDMANMFLECYSLTSIDLSGFNTSKVTNMELMFCDLSLTALDVSAFNTENVENMFSMFAGCDQLATLDLSGFNTSKVKDMTVMFADCDSLRSLDLSGFNTSKVTSMSAMFSGCESLSSLDLSGFNTSNVTHMNSMFHGCESLTSLDLSHFNTSNVAYMDEMFEDCVSLTSLDLSGFNTSNVTYMNGMFYLCNRLETIYVGKGWRTDSLTSSNRMFYGCTSLIGEQGTTYDENHVDASYAHIDGGPSNPGYLSVMREAYAVLSSNQTTLTFYCDAERSTRPGTSYILNTGTASPGWCEYAGDITLVQFDSTFVTAHPTSTFSWFYQMNRLDSISGITYLNTNSVKDMRRMFWGCDSLTALDLSSFETDSVTNMWGMFVGCKSLKSIDLSSFNTSSVTNMARMFSDCSSLTSLDLSNFNTDNLKDMAGMFAGCKSLASLDLSSFRTNGVKYMSWVFDGCKSLTSLDMSGFNTSNVTEMEAMYNGCDSLTSLDLSRFNTSKVWSMKAMFNNCNHLQTIYASNSWRTNAVTESSAMFYGCTHLVGGQGTTYDKNHVDATRAHIDGGPSDPGYLTGKGTIQRGDVNADGEVNIADVNCLIDVIQGGADTYEGRADVNADGEVTIADTNTVIDIILRGAAPI